MGNIETTISGRYVPEWALAEGLRELISNALDAETRHEGLGVGRASVAWSPADGGTVFIANWGITCPDEFWLMGESESRDNDGAIGQFGEGGPLGCLALVRAGHRVLMDNGPVRWEPTLSPSSRFGGKTVLTIRTRKLRKERPGFEVSITGVSREQYDAARVKFLGLKGFDPADTTGFWEERMSSVRKPGVLLDPSERGNVYVKGVLVTNREDLLFGYNFQLEELNRDRNSIQEHDIAHEAKSVLARGCRHRPDVLNQVAAAALAEWAAEDEPLEVRSAYGSLGWDDTVADAVAEKFVAEHGEDAVPVDSEDEAKEAEKFGLKPLRLTALGRKIIQRRTGSVSDRIAKAKQAIVREWEGHELPHLTRNNLRLAALLSTSVGRLCSEVRVVAFKGKNLALWQSCQGKDPAFLVEREVADSLHMILVRMLSREELARVAEALIDNDWGEDLTMVLLDRSSV